jgi:uncharacterized protein (TIGR02757 family)
MSVSASWGADRLDRLADALARLQVQLDPVDAMQRDPLGVVREQPQAEWEVAAHVAALLAYGRVAQVRAAVRSVLAAMRPNPSTFLGGARTGDLEATLPPGWVYRMTKAGDVDDVVVALRRVQQRFGGLEAAFVAHDEGAGDLRGALEGYVGALRAALPERAGRGARYLLADPATGSATKRWHLLLRWLVREEGDVDLGQWSKVSPARLILPLDTHTGRLVSWLGLSDRRVDDYRKAREATDVLARIDPDDPVRFDLALCHLGISGACRHAWVPSICSACPLAGLCRWTFDRSFESRATIE